MDSTIPAPFSFEELNAKLSSHLVDGRIARYATDNTAVRELLRNAKLAAQTTKPVLIRGESGTGKELLARIMLFNKPNSDFYPVNCAGLPDMLFESILFGYRKGAFTGAIADKDGILTRAGAGVVFFDEVGELTLTQQAKLLRVLQEKRILPVGALEEIPISCRFVFATNRNLEAMLATYKAGVPGLAFREDLYHRISALTLTTIPLRERPADALHIAQHICNIEGYDKPDRLPPELIQSDGNVRAIENWLTARHVFGIGEDGLNPASSSNVRETVSFL